MMLSHALLARLVAKSSQSEQTEQFLLSAVPKVRAEPGTLAWFAVRFGRHDFGIFDAFGEEAARQAHLQGPVAQALSAQSPQLFERAPDIARLDVLASKMPSSSGQPVTCGLLLSFEAKAGHEGDVAQFLRGARSIVEDEPGTLAWFALHWADQARYGIFDVFPDHAARTAHLTGHVPRELAKHALKLVGGMPSMHLLDVLAAHVAESAVQTGLGVH